MYIIYVDDSRDEALSVFSALAVPAAQWKQAFVQIKAFRKALRDSDGIYIFKEFHAWKFVSGRGRIAEEVVPKGRRCRIFMEVLRLMTRLPEARLFNVVAPLKKENWAFERLVNRVNRTMVAMDRRAILICDQGKETEYTRLVRRMGVFNPIPSQFGSWAGQGELTKNIPIDRIIEDPVFKRSDQSYFLQMADFAAYALLRRERPLASKTKYGLDKAFGLLSGILVREASPRDPDGIIRVQ